MKSFRLNSIASLLLIVVFSILGAGCGGGGGGGSSASGGGEDVGFIAQVLSPVDREISLTRGDSVTFAAFHTLQEDCSYSWNFGDGRSSTEKEPGSVQYTVAGDYTVTLTVTRSGYTLSDTRTVHVLNPSDLNAQIVSPSGDVVINTGGNIEFHGNATGGGTQKTYSWNFGNGQVSTMKDPGIITYAASGDYDVTLTVQDNLAGIDQATVHIKVNAAPINTTPVASITTPASDTLNITEGDTVSFMGAVVSGESPYTYDWDFDAAADSRATLDGGSVTFTTAGTYVITFSVWDKDSDLSSDTVTIIVNPKSAGGDWAYVSAGSLHTLAIKKDGTLWAFGNGENGKLGTGKTTNEYTPVLVDAGPWLIVSAGTNHSVGIKADHTLWSWGRRIGFGVEMTNKNSQPVQVGTEANWTMASAGEDFTLAIKGGALYAAGSNGGGMLGLGDYNSRLSFTQVGTDADWSYISCGGSHVAALKGAGSTHDLYTWGSNLQGQLGLGDRTTRTSPVQVGTEKWLKVASGFNFTLAIRSDAALYATGYDRAGACGYGQMTTLTSFTRIGSATWNAIYAGPLSNHSMATPLSSLTTLYATGENVNGQLGKGNRYDTIFFTEMANAGPVQMASGGYDRTVLIKTDGTMWATGDNQYGQCGFGTTVLESLVLRKID